MVFTRIGREIKTFFCFWTLVTLSPFLAVSLFRKSFTFMSFLKHSNVFFRFSNLTVAPFLDTTSGQPVWSKFRVLSS